MVSHVKFPGAGYWGRGWHHQRGGHRWCLAGRSRTTVWKLRELLRSRDFDDQRMGILTTGGKGMASIFTRDWTMDGVFLIQTWGLYHRDLSLRNWDKPWKHRDLTVRSWDSPSKNRDETIKNIAFHFTSRFFPDFMKNSNSTNRT